MSDEDDDKKIGVNLGATGKFPEGKIAPADEGETRFAVGARRDGIVILNFGSPVSWLGMDVVRARMLATSLRKQADRAEAMQKKDLKDAKRRGLN